MCLKMQKTQCRVGRNQLVFFIKNTGKKNGSRCAAGFAGSLSVFASSICFALLCWFFLDADTDFLLVLPARMHGVSSPEFSVEKQTKIVDAN